MKVAIIGGGASGLIAAYHVSAVHDVHLFEKQDVLGGNIRTLNGNIDAPGVPADLRIENGVLGFHKQSYPTLHALLDELGVETETKQPSSALHRRDRLLPSEPKHLLNGQVWPKLLSSRGYLTDVRNMRRDYAATFRRIVRSDPSSDAPISEFFGETDVLNDFVQALAALAFSTPFEEAGDLPVSLVAPYLHSTKYPDWTRLKNGVFSYVEALLAKRKFAVTTGAGDVVLSRVVGGVEIAVQGETLKFDRAIVATTPGQVLKILTDADDAERHLFGPWKDRVFRTQVHTTTDLYGRFKFAPHTPMDLFVDKDGPGRGYNTYMNDFYGIDGNRTYSFAYNLEEAIAPSDILSTADHIVPVHTVVARSRVPEICASSGRRRVHYCGAYLSDGLHEGAAVSALRVSKEIMALA
ncbi:MAG: FAD-dependent oxidoreductase [Pseudomonadota bacterium]